MAEVRSILGTIIFILIAQVHFVSLFQVLELLLDFYFMDWVHLSAQIFQLATFFVTIILLIRPVMNPIHRLSIAGLCILSILINITAYSWGYHDFDTIKLMFFWFTIVDIIPIIAFSVPPNHFLAKLAPFYQDGDKDEPDQASSVEEGDSASNETSTS